jgi:serine protease
LFNPSIVPHPDQSGAPKGGIRFILSLRAIGEGHVSSLTFRAGAVAAEYNPARTRPGATAESGVDRVIVKFRDSSVADAARTKPAAEKVAALATRTGIPLKQTRRLGADLQVLEFGALASRESLATSVARLRADPEVEYADLDQRRYPHAIPNDTLFPGQWYLQSDAVTPSAVDAVRAWDSTTGSAGIVIADIDTGVRFDHPDLLAAGLGGRLLPGFDFVSDPRRANDGDGWDPDASDPGDWVTTTEASSSEFSGCAASDSSWHGTRVAGIIGALTNNSQGVAGLGWNGWILPARVLGKCGGNDSDILAAMLWAGGIAVDGVSANPYPARIINMSLGASGACPQSYLNVVNQMLARGVLVVASVGNEGGFVDAPANCPGVAGVGALRHAGTKVGFSNLGPGVALSAPGGNCVNTGAGQPCLYSIDTTTNDGPRRPGKFIHISSKSTLARVSRPLSSPALRASWPPSMAASRRLRSSRDCRRAPRVRSRPRATRPCRCATSRPGLLTSRPQSVCAPPRPAARAWRTQPVPRLRRRAPSRPLPCPQASHPDRTSCCEGRGVRRPASAA